MEIQKGKVYRTRGGDKAKVLYVDGSSANPFPVTVQYSNGMIDALMRNGRAYWYKESVSDLIEEVDAPVEPPGDRSKISEQDEAAPHPDLREENDRLRGQVYELRALVTVALNTTMDDAETVDALATLARIVMARTDP